MLRNVREGVSPYKRVGSTGGEDVSLNDGNTSCSSPVQGSSTATDFRIEGSEVLQSCDKSHTRGQGGDKMVAIQSRPFQWKEFDYSSTTNSDPDRCLQKRVGSSMSGSKHRWPLVAGGTTGTHKCVRTESSQDRAAYLHSNVQSNISAHTNGQHNSFEVFVKNGGYKKLEIESNQQRDLGFFNGREDHSYCRIPSRSSQRCGRQGVTVEGFERMETKSMGVSKNLSSERDPRHRLVCFKGFKSSTSILFLEDGSEQQGSRCFSTGLEVSKGLCLPPLFIDREGSQESGGGSEQCDLDNPSMAKSTMVPYDPSIVSDESHFVTSESGLTEGSGRTNSSSSSKWIPKADCLDIVRQQLSSEGLSKEASSLIVQSRRVGTQSHYKSAWKQWASWCFREQIDPIGCPVNFVLEFLTSLYSKGLQYSTIGGYRSAISAFHDRCEGFSVGEHPMVKRLMTGIFNCRPSMPRYGFTWDVEVVLRYLNDLDTDTISDKLLSLKLTTLLALTTASRASELSMLDIRFLSRYDSVYVFELVGITKTQRPGGSPTKLEFFKFKENLSLCVCHTIDVYLGRMKKKGVDLKQLLVSFIKPHLGVSTDTISRWLKESIGLAGIDTKNFKGHSTRSASTSKAASQGLSVKEILSRANWSNESTFQKFYNKEI